MKIGEIAAATGVRVETIRFYEREGLVPPPARTSSNYRSYGEVHRQRLTFIRRARGLGFSLGQVRELLDLAEVRDQSCVAVGETARKHRAQVQEKIVDLSALRKELDHMIDQCRLGSISGSRIIQSLADGPAG